MTPRIRQGRPDDAPFLPDIERQAAALFAAIDLWVPPDLTEVSDFEEAADEERLLVATDENDHPIGFALLECADDTIHLEEVDVLPRWGRRGIGRALVEATLAWARSRGYSAVTLCTFRELPWNGPFYQRCGFTFLEGHDIDPHVRECLQHEVDLGLDPAMRCAMRYMLS